MASRKESNVDASGEGKGGDASKWLWVIHEQIQFDGECEREGVVVTHTLANSGMSMKGFYRTKASANAACEQSFYKYMEKEFGWDRQQVQDNFNEHLWTEPGQVGMNGLAMYYWEGRVQRKVWKQGDVGEDGFRDEVQVEVNQYAVISCNPFAVVLSD